MIGGGANDGKVENQTEEEQQGSMVYLRVLHDAVDAVKVRQFIDGFCRVLQHPLHRLHTNTSQSQHTQENTHCTYICQLNGT